MYKSVLITGITGQDGSYLAESLLSQGTIVHGFVRRTSTLRRDRIDFLSQEHILSGQLQLHYIDMNDALVIHEHLKKIRPEIIFNLAAQSHVGISFELPRETIQTTGIGTQALLEAIRGLNMEIPTYQAGSSEMFGGMLGRKILNEESQFFPKSPYGAAKVLAHNLAVIYRESYGLDIRNGILFNHESPRRGENFVSRKITLSAAKIFLGKQEKLSLGNLKAQRDWGHARDYVDAMQKIMTFDKAEDFVIATGQMYSVRDFVQLVFDKLNLNIDEHLVIDQKFFRPNEVEDLVGDASKAKQLLGWSPKTTFDELVNEMLESDLRLARTIA